jgi:protein O-GlcNAc transferase
LSDTRQVVKSALDHFRAQRLDQSADLLRRALQKDPRHPGANQLYALTLMAQNKIEAAEFYIGRAIAAEPNHAEFHVNLGLIKSSSPDRLGAEASFRRALELEPTRSDAAARLGVLLSERGAHDEAIRVLGEALKVDALGVQAASAMAKVLSDMGNTDEAVTMLRLTLQRATAAGKPIDPGAISLLCLLTNYVEASPAAVMETHRLFGQHLKGAAPPAKQPAIAPKPSGRDGRIRVGYLSPDLRRHSVTFFLEPLLASHDRSRFDVFVYSLGAHIDDVTRRLQPLAEHWRQVGPLQDGLVLETLRRDQLDFLIELSGHTTNHRLAMLAHRAASVQASFLGYPATTGAPGIDVRLVDSITDPEGADLYASERLVRLPKCFLCYRAPDEAPVPASRPEGPLVFASFNNPAKISDATVDLWSRALSAVPDSRLLLKGSSLALASVQEAMKARLSRRGLDPSRIDFLGMMPDPLAHLSAYNRVDIGLDPTPYNGTTTTCEALWMGVPVITLRGQTHAARVGASLLSAAGLPDLIASTPDEFCRIATALAADPARRGEYRRTLRERLARSPLCDAATYAADFERTLESLLKRST